MSLQGDRQNAYTTTPGLSDNYIKGSLQLLSWILIHPSAWKNNIQNSDSSLDAYLCLAVLKRRHWRKVQIRQLFAYLSLLLIATGLAATLFSLIQVVPNWGLWAGILLGFLVALAISLLVTIPSGLLAGMVALLFLPILLGDGTTLLVDVLLDYKLGLFFGVLAGVSSLAVVNLGEIRFEDALVAQIGGTILGLLAMMVVAAFFAGLLGLVTIAWQRGIVGEQLVTFIVVFVIILFFYVLIWLRTASKPIRLSLILLVLLVATLLTTFDGRAGYGVHMGGRRLLVNSVMIFTASFLILYALAFTITYRIAGPRPAALTALIAGQAIHLLIGFTFSLYAWPTQLLISFAAALLIFSASWWRPLLTFPIQSAWHTFLWQSDQGRGATAVPLYHHHSAFWDDLQTRPWPGLDEHLVLVLERWPEEGQRALDYLLNSPQRWAARTAQIEIDARLLAGLADVEALAQVHIKLGSGGFAGPASALLRSFSRISQDVQAALQQASTYNQRLALRSVADHLDGLNRELVRSTEPYAARFQSIATHWQRLISDHITNLTKLAETRQEFANPYIIGVPLTAHQSIFVGRTAISARIEYLLLDQQQPPLLLYGQRRMGKTSLLNNLGRLLPSHLMPLFVDLQGPVSFASNEAALFYNLARSMVSSARKLRDITLPSPLRTTFEADAFTAFDEWLDDISEKLASIGVQTILLALDEFESLDSALVAGRFDKTAVLGTLRHLIQHSPQFKILLSGSHTLQEFERWASYFINAQLIHISYLQPEEALQLIEKPVQDFTLRYRPAANRYVLELTHGHPFLLQLLCNEIVILKNEQAPEFRRLAAVDDVETAVAPALKAGHLFFTDIARNQIGSTEHTILDQIAAQGAGGTCSYAALQTIITDQYRLNTSLDLLLRRELLQKHDNHYRFQVEMIRQWFVPAG